MEVLGDAVALLDQSNGAIGLVQGIEISHSKWAQTYYFVVNSNSDMTLTHEDNSQHLYTYAPITIELSSENDTLESSVSFTFGDLGDTIPQLIDAFIYDEEIELPKLSYRSWLIGSYALPYMVAKDLEIENITRTWEGTKADARAPSLNDSGNGEVYNATDDPSLIGYY